MSHLSGPMMVPPQRSASAKRIPWPERIPLRTSVCHLISGDLWAGAEVQAASLIRALSDRPEVRVSAIVLNEGRLALELRQAGVEVAVLPESQCSFLQILKSAENVLRFRRPDILHSHRYKENLLSLLLARKCRVPVTVRTQHGLPEPFRGLGGTRHSAVQLLDRLSGRLWADAVIGVSAEMMPKLERLYGERVALVRNGIDLNAVHSSLSRAQARARVALPEAVPVFGMVGRMEPIKRVDLFLQAAAMLKQRFSSAHFVVSGSGSLSDKLCRQATTLGIDDCTHFLGHRDDVYDVLRSLDALVMCSDHEGLPMVLLEALWLGVPVVGRGVGGILEVLGDNDCGLITSSDPQQIAAACARLLEDTTLQDRLRHNAEMRVSDHFSLQWSTDEIVRLYRDLILKRRLNPA